jgi:hypothetical protein
VCEDAAKRADGSDEGEIEMGVDRAIGESEAALTVNARVAHALSLSAHLARQNIMTCATLLNNTATALDDGSEAIALDHVLDVEPLLFEAQTVLNAASIIRRRAREGIFGHS